MSLDLAEQKSPSAERTRALNTNRVHFKHIVVGTDFSDQAARALKVAISLARMFGANLTLVHAVSPIAFDLNGREVSCEAVAAGRDADEEELDQLVEDTSGLKELKPRTFVMYGEPSHLINRISRDENADLIVLGSHGASGLERIALGSIAETVLRRSTCPVLIIGPECQVERDFFRSILFATDLKTTGGRGTQYTADLAEQFHAELTVLHVQSKKFLSSGILQELFRDHVRRKLRRLLPTKIDRLCKTKVRFELGDPSAVIIAVAREESASLLIVGARDRALSDHAPWSALSHIIHDAKCPVLGIRDRRN